MNEKGTEGYPGGFDPGTNTVIYAQYTNQGSDIGLFDLDTMTGVQGPRSMRTSAVEFDPHISTAYFSFFRWQRVNGVRYANLYPYDWVAKSMTKIATIQNRSGQYFLNDFLGEHYASWTNRTGPDIANTMSLDVGDLVFSKYSCSDGVGIYSLPGADT